MTATFDLSLNGNVVTLRAPSFGISLNLDLRHVVSQILADSPALRALEPFFLSVLVSFVRQRIDESKP